MKMCLENVVLWYSFKHLPGTLYLVKEIAENVARFTVYIYYNENLLRGYFGGAGKFGVPNSFNKKCAPICVP